MHPHELDQMGLQSNFHLARHFNRYEVEALFDVCAATGEDIHKLTVKQGVRYLRLFYTLPHAERLEPDAYMAQAVMAARAAGVLCRYEYEHFGDWPLAVDDAEALLQKAIKHLETAQRELNKRRPSRREG